jgi:hypothetical protein
MTDPTGTDAAYRDLLAAIRDALDLPQPAAAADRQSFDSLRQSRAGAALAVLDTILDVPECAVRVETATEILRERIAQLPVLYRPYDPARPERGNFGLPPTEPQVAPSLTGRESADVR